MLGNQDHNTLTEIQRLLNLSGFSHENHRRELDQYRATLESDEQLNAAYFEQMRGHRLDSFKAGKDYQSWINSVQSCLLILSGHNNRSIDYIDQCWLSPIAMAMITDLSHCASHIIYTYYVFPSKGELLYRALSVILFQLLSQKNKVLRNKSQYDELRAELHEWQRYEHQSNNNNNKNNKNNKNSSNSNSSRDIEDERLAAFHNVALRVVNFFDESETLYVILDRADRCCILKKGLDHRKDLLKALIKIVEAARCKLRVLVVINGDQWDVEHRRDELGKMTEKVIVHAAEQGNSD